MLPGNGVEKRHDLLKDSGALDNRVRHCAHLRWKLADFVTLNAFRRVLDEINRIVEIVSKREDVFPVDRCIEGAIGSDEYFLGDPIGLGFQCADRGNMDVIGTTCVDHAA